MWNMTPISMMTPSRPWKTTNAIAAVRVAKYSIRPVLLQMSRPDTTSSVSSMAKMKTTPLPMYDSRGTSSAS